MVVKSLLLTVVFMLLLFILSACSNSNNWTEVEARAFLDEWELSSSRESKVFVRIEPDILYLDDMPEFLMARVTNPSDSIQYFAFHNILQRYDGESWVNILPTHSSLAFLDSLFPIEPNETCLFRAKNLADFTDLTSGKYRISNEFWSTHYQWYSIFFILD